MSFIRLNNVFKSYDTRPVLREVYFKLNEGDRVGLIGKNGTYVSFNQVFAELDLTDSVTHAVNVVGLAYSQPRKIVNRCLSLMQFSEMDLNQRIGALSGGQVKPLWGNWSTWQGGKIG